MPINIHTFFDPSKYEVPVTQVSDLPTPIGGIHYLADYKTYRFQGLVNIGTNSITIQQLQRYEK